MRTSFLITFFISIIIQLSSITVQCQILNVPASFPQYKVTANNSPDDGYFFLAADLMPNKQPGYLIMIDNFGTPVYYRYFDKVLNSFGVQPNGLISYMARGTAGAKFYLMDNTFKTIDSLVAKAPFPKTDPHDFLALPNGHFVFLANDPRTMDMSAYGGKTNATVTGCVVQEQDENKNVVFNWNTWDNFKISDSYADLTVSSVDLIHHNCVEVDSDGNIYLLSRSLNEVTKIDRLTGKIIWRLGGKNNQFTFSDPSSVFASPHDFRVLPSGNITFFDNGNERVPPYSRAVEYSINQTTKVVTLVWSFDADKKIYADNSGSSTKLETGNTVIGYGYSLSNPAILEVHPDRSIAFRLELPDKVTSYRAFKAPWQNKLFEPLSKSINFGLWDGYTTAEYLLTMKNNSNSAITLTSYSTRTSAFKIQNTFPVSIPANGQVILTVTYFPAAINTGVIKDVLTINSDINTASLVQRISQQVQLSGTKTDAVAPVATVPLANNTRVSRDTVICINFNEPVRKLDNSEFTYTNIDQFITFKKDNANGDNVLFDAVINTDRNQVSIIPKVQMDPDQYYFLAFSNVYEDYSNNAGAAISALFKTSRTTTGLEENQKSILKVYPNPGTGLFNLEFTSQTLKRVTVTDMNGRSVFENNSVSGSSLQLDLRHEREGIYLLHVKEEITGTINVVKLIKQNGGE